MAPVCAAIQLNLNPHSSVSKKTSRLSTRSVPAFSAMPLSSEGITRQSSTRGSRCCGSTQDGYDPAAPEAIFLRGLFRSAARRALSPHSVPRCPVPHLLCCYSPTFNPDLSCSWMPKESKNAFHFSLG